MVGTDVASIGATGGITGRSIGSVCGRAGAPSTPSIAPMVDSTQDATDRAVQRAERLRELHRPGEPLVLVNVWDVLGARVVAAQGARAVATASWAMSAAAGRPDGEGLDLSENLTVVARIAAAVDLPVTGDLERGYGRTPEHVASSVLRLLTAGAVGCNIEDSLVRLGQPSAGRTCPLCSTPARTWSPAGARWTTPSGAGWPTSAPAPTASLCSACTICPTSGASPMRSRAA